MLHTLPPSTLLRFLNHIQCIAKYEQIGLATMYKGIHMHYEHHISHTCMRLSTYRALYKKSLVSGTEQTEEDLTTATNLTNNPMRNG